MFKWRSKKILTYELLNKQQNLLPYSNYIKFNLLFINKTIQSYNGLNTFNIQNISHFSLKKTLFNFTISQQPKPYPFKKIKN